MKKRMESRSIDYPGIDVHSRTGVSYPRMGKQDPYEELSSMGINTLSFAFILDGVRSNELYK